nr:MAG: hypothetical protein [Caudoviricetes sp.]
MTDTELKKYGFEIQVLPSGRINLANVNQFKINGLIAYLQVKGQYHRTIESFSYIKKVEIL